MLLSQLKTEGILIRDALADTTLSPSFYQPWNLLLYYHHLDEDCDDFIRVSSGFNHLHAWVLLPEFFKLCHDYFKTPRIKTEYLLFIKALLHAGQQKAQVLFHLVGSIESGILKFSFLGCQPSMSFLVLMLG